MLIKKRTYKKHFSDLFTAFGVEQRRSDMIKILNICVALSLIFSFSIFGYINIEPISMTTVHIPVIIAAMLTGPFGGMITGLVFGLTSMWKASLTATAYADIIFSPWKSSEPVSSLILCIGTRMLFGFLTGLMFSATFRYVKTKKLYGLLAAVNAVIATMLHSLLVNGAMKAFFPKAGASLLGALEPSARHIAVWVVSLLVTLAAYHIFASKYFIKIYREVIEYKHEHKTGADMLMLVVVAVFFLVSAAIVMHSFDRLLLINPTNVQEDASIQPNSVNIALQQLVAQVGVIYIIALIVSFFYDRTAVVNSKLEQKEREQLYQERLKNTLDVLQALTGDYEVVFDTDIENGVTKIYRMSSRIASQMPDNIESLDYENGRRVILKAIVSPEELDDVLKNTTYERMKQILTSGVITSRVVRNYQDRFCEIRAVPINDNEFIFGCADVDAVIREQKRQQKELEKAMLAANAANEAKSSFLLNMSHDIRTPMNAIIGYTDVLERSREDKEKFENSLANIRASGEYLLDLINNVLEMSRIESGKEVLRETPCDIREVLSSAYIVFDEQARRQGKKFIYRREVTHDYIYADPVKIRQIHLNVLSNAIKYTRAGGTITMTSRELESDKEGWCRIQMQTRDTGVGISKEFLEHIFDDFARENDSTTSGVGGTGLGMGIVKKLVTMMNGTVEIESEKGKGTVVTITIPHRIADSSALEKDNAVTDEKLSEIKGKRILLAEDNDINAEIAAELLEDEGVIVERARDGAECVQMLGKAEAGHYDLILMDVQMPNMDGYLATRTIRKLSDEKKAAIPIIAMTANAYEQDRKRALESGMNEHISKPISLEKLNEAITKYI